MAKPTKTNNPEEQVQSAVVEYLKWQYSDIRYCASLGGIRTSMRQAIKAKRTGYIKGFPDLQILHANSEYHGLFLEIKPHKKAYPTKEQKEWIAYLNEKGYFAKCCKGFDECIETVDWYMKIH